MELQVQLPNEDEASTVNIELAPLDVMPHSVQTFLDQVHEGLWDGGRFGWRAGHVLMAHSSSADDRAGGASDVTRGATEGTASAPRRQPRMAFPEYDERYPHERYTVSFPSRSTFELLDPPPPSSPDDESGTTLDFYVNLRSNVEHHAPRVGTGATGGYVHGESCFGRITEGASRDVIDRIGGGGGGLGDVGVVVRSARIVSG